MVPPSRLSYTTVLDLSGIFHSELVLINVPEAQFPKLRKVLSFFQLFASRVQWLTWQCVWL